MDQMTHMEQNRHAHLDHLLREAIHQGPERPWTSFLAMLRMQSPDDSSGNHFSGLSLRWAAGSSPPRQRAGSLSIYYKRQIPAVMQAHCTYPFYLGSSVLPPWVLGGHKEPALAGCTCFLPCSEEWNCLSWTQESVSSVSIHETATYALANKVKSRILTHLPLGCF